MVLALAVPAWAEPFLDERESLSDAADRLLIMVCLDSGGTPEQCSDEDRHPKVDQMRRDFYDILADRHLACSPKYESYRSVRECIRRAEESLAEDLELPLL